MVATTIGINPGPAPSVRRTKGVEFHQNIHSRGMYPELIY